MAETHVIDKYEILEQIGRGGFATVYKARDTDLGRVVALKVLHPYWADERDFAVRFRNEARAAANLSHHGIVTVYDAGEASGQLYIAMEYLPGRTLRDLLDVEGALPLAQALPILEQVADALDYAHEQGIVHRDIKPANIMVEETARGVRVTLTDFGLVKALEASTALTSQGTLLGSPEYMAPEQADPERVIEIGPATDRYALGVVAYQMLAGRVPFPGNTPSTLNAHLNLDVPDPARFVQDLSPAVTAVLMKMLAKAPTDRFATALDFIAQLEAAERQHLAGIPSTLELTEAPVERQQDAGIPPVPAPDTPRQSLAPVKPQPGFSLRQIPAWVWGIGAGVVVILLGWMILPGILSGGDGFGSAEPTLTLTSVPSSAPVPEPTSTPTSTSSSQPESTLTSLAATNTPGSSASDATTQAADTWERSADDMVMVYVPGGEFQMGSTEGEIEAAFQSCNEVRGTCVRGWFEDERPVHTVALDNFWLDRTEVMNGQYVRCVEDGVCAAPTICDDGDATYGRESMDEHPVVCVSWFDAQTYCAWAGGRLPTEAEWEYAARGADRHIYPWGNDFDRVRANFCDANCQNTWAYTKLDDGFFLTSPVANFGDGASWCSVYDMAGNVGEWTADWYADQYPAALQTNPQGSESGANKVVRGGSWYTDVSYVRSAARIRYLPEHRDASVGFRCVMDSIED